MVVTFTMVRTIILSILTVFTFSNKLTALPGGYFGLSFLFDFKSKEKGLQFSTGLALPFVGEPSLGPYAFPGVTLGLRHTNNKGFYSYIDIQIVASNAVWAGAGLGLAFKEGNQYIRKKYFMGFLPIGYVKESTRNKDSSSAMNDFRAIYLGGAIPLIGSHFKP